MLCPERALALSEANFDLFAGTNEITFLAKSKTT
jgi:hypothetical protein